VLLGPGAGAPSAYAQAEQPYLLRLRTREFTPAPGLELAAIRALRAGQPEESVHFLVQFVDLPDSAARQQFAGQGLDLIAYVTGNAYVAAARVADLDQLHHVAGVRWAGPLEVDDKIGPDLRAGRVGAWAQVGDDGVALTVQLHQDVDVAVGEALVAQLGGTVVTAVPAIPAVTAVFALAGVERLAREDAVQYVDVVDPPLQPSPSGAGAATTEPQTAPPPAAAVGQPPLPGGPPCSD
jgi:hypothetical protein